MTRERKRSRYEMALLSENFKFFRRFPDAKNVTACLVLNNSPWLWRPEWSLLVSCFKMMLTMTDVVCGVQLLKQLWIEGRGPGSRPRLIFRPKWGPKGRKNCFETGFPPLLIWRSGSATVKDITLLMNLSENYCTLLLTVVAWRIRCPVLKCGLYTNEQ